MKILWWLYHYSEKRCGQLVGKYFQHKKHTWIEALELKILSWVEWNLRFVLFPQLRRPKERNI
jgi:hypothetical protein